MIHTQADTDRCVHVHVVGMWKHLQSQMWTQWELEPRHRQQATIEATDTGERARGWFLRHFRVCRCLHHNKPPRAQPRCQEVQGARALLLAEGGIPCKTLQDLKPIGCLTFETYLGAAKTKWKHMAIRHRSSKFKSNSETCCRSLQMHSQCFLGTCRFVQAQGERQDQPHICAYCQSFV